METMPTIPRLLAGLGFTPIASAKLSHSNDVSESLCEVLESSEVNDDISSPGGYTTMGCPCACSIGCRSGSRTPQLLEYSSLYLGTEPRGNEGDFNWCQSQLHLCLATQVFVNKLSMALQSLIFLLQEEAHERAEATPRTIDPLWPRKFWKC